MTAYGGSLRAVVLDWSGTVIDHGSRAPALVFVDLFRAAGVAISVDEARGPMGTYKRDHIAALLGEPSIRARWEAAHGRAPTEADVDALFADFNPRQIAITRQYTELIPGALDAVAAFRARGLKIGTCTGYTRPIMDAVAPIAAGKGFTPDSITTPEEVPAGRPAPYMIYLTALKLAVYPLAALVKIGDTPVDIEEGLHAGVWTVGLARTGNELGLSADEVAALDPADRAARLERARARLGAAGAHYVVDSLADVPALLDDIEARLARGERP
jgi:phosphonoacetaldehyde hydrolase